MVGTALLAALAVAITGAAWAYAWLAAEIVTGGGKLLAVHRFAKAGGSRGAGNPMEPVAAGIASLMVFSAGCYQCAASGDWMLFLMAGVALGNMIGGVSSRNAGTPRYGLLLIAIVALPFAVAALQSPARLVFVIGLQIPVYGAAMGFLLMDNYRVLLNLFLSERENLRLAHYDQLTALPNRAMNLKQFDRLLGTTAAGSCCQTLTVLCLDLDGFKAVNDRFGHGAGDAVLIEVAERLRDCVRKPDMISRLGGDEFIILLPDFSPDDTAALARRIIASISRPFEVGLAAPLRLGVSIGSASAPRDETTADALLSAADRAMYAAKRDGKGGFVAHVAAAPPLVPAPEATAIRGFPLPTPSNSL